MLSHARRAVHALAAIVICLAASLMPARATEAAPVPPPYPGSMASLGDSITRAFNTGSIPYLDAPSNSWSTGTNATVNSLRTRFGAATAQNLAVSGAAMADLNGQAAGVQANTEFVTILMGANDLCADSEAEMTAVAMFGAQFATAMTTLTTTAPNATVYVVSIPDVMNLWTLFHDNATARLIWSLFGICQSLLDNPTSMDPADVDRRARVRQRNIDYNTKLAEVCAAFTKCRTDGGAVFAGAVVADDVTTRDYFHPSLAGQTKLAATAWGPDITGGKNLKITTGSIDLSWEGGTAQDSYSLLQYNTSTTAASLIPLGGAATSYSDAGATASVVYCYALAALNGATFLGLSDLLCGMTGLQSGTVVPGGFALALNQTANASMAWTAPAGGADSYLLQVIPLDGSPVSNVPLGGGVTATTQAVTAAGTCFQLIGFKAGGFGTTNLLCGVPGVSTLGTGTPAGHRTTSELMASVSARVQQARLAELASR